MFVSAISHIQSILPAQDNRCKSGTREAWGRMEFLNRVVPWKPHPLIGTSGIPAEMAAFVALINDTHAMIARFLWAHRKVHTIAKTISYASGARPSSRNWRTRRMIVTSLIKLITSKRKGLGFTPTLKNSAQGALMLYHFLKLAGICAQPAALVEHASRYCVRVALDPRRHDKLIAIDLTLLMDDSITADSVIDYYDGDIAKLQTRPLTFRKLTAAYRKQAIDLPDQQR